MGHLALEVADIFHTHGPAWRKAQQGHLSLGQLKVMSAIEQCRSAALGGHVLHCDGCGHDQVAYNLDLDLTRFHGHIWTLVFRPWSYRALG